MYEILFIDDRFEEIKNVFLELQKENIRCYYSDGDNGLPSGDENLVFKNLQYVCLDLHLENRGINKLENNPTAYSTLASILETFNLPEEVKVIINSSFAESFDETELKKYVSSKFNNIEFVLENKDAAKFSTLSNSKEEIKTQTKNRVFRDIVIREAIDIENLLWAKINENFPEIVENKSEDILTQFSKSINFKNKIALYNFYNSNLSNQLTDIRNLRNEWAHREYPSSGSVTIIDFLKLIEDVKNQIYNN